MMKENSFLRNLEGEQVDIAETVHLQERCH